jgi:hypothetical protein
MKIDQCDERFRDPAAPAGWCVATINLSPRFRRPLARMVVGNVHIRDLAALETDLDLPVTGPALSRPPSPLGVPPNRFYRIVGAGVPSDQCVTGTMITLIASGDSWNCRFSIGGAPGRSAPQVAPTARGK